MWFGTTEIIEVMALKGGKRMMYRYSPLLRKKTLSRLPLSADLLDKEPLSGFKGFILWTRTEILISSKSSPESHTL